MKKKNLILFFIILFSLLFLIFFIPSTYVLSISNRKNPSEVVYSREGYKEGFIISYTHSVNKGRVHDYYKVLDNNNLELYQTQFVSYGAGIPEPEETPGAYFEVTDDGYFIKNLNRVLDKFLMAVGVIADHSIIISQDISKKDTNNEIFLDTLFKPQTSLIFKIEKKSLFSLIIKPKI